MDVVLVVAGGVGDVETVALAGVPLGVDAVESQRDLAGPARATGSKITQLAKAAAETAPAKVVRVGSFEDTFNYVNEKGARKGCST